MKDVSGDCFSGISRSSAFKISYGKTTYYLTSLLDKLTFKIAKLCNVVFKTRGFIFTEF